MQHLQKYAKISTHCMYLSTVSESCSGPMVSALDSGSTGPGTSLGQVIVLCSWQDTFLS